MAVRLAFCGLDEVDALTAFLRDHWDREHVLVTDRRVLDWQHRDEARGRYDVLMAWDGDEVVGILGFIPTSRYDPDLADGRETVWLTTWRARDGAAPGLGLLLLRGLRERLRPTWTGTVGLRPETRGIYDRLGFRTGALTRMILLDDARDERHLAAVPVPPPSAVRAAWRTHAPAATEPVTAAALAALAERHRIAAGAARTAPARTAASVRRRYLEHPFHVYRVDLVPATDRHDGALVVTRTVGHAGATAVRVVDLIGDPDAAASTGPLLRGLLEATGAEWLDASVTSDVVAPLRAAGLVPVAEVPGLVPAAYFAPFELRDRTVLWALDGPGDRPHLVRGDADQDRPNPPPPASAEPAAVTS